MTTEGIVLGGLLLIVFGALFGLGLSRAPLMSVIAGMIIGAVIGLLGYRILGYTGFLGNLTVFVGIEIAGFLLGKLVRRLRAERAEMRESGG